MNATYLVRFDDICPAMNWTLWEQVEGALIEHGIKPILAVVPDNRDEQLQVEEPRSDFWQRVRVWQERGWTIGLHGYQHRYITRDAGIVGLNDRSEFAGLPAEEQERKLRAGLEIFRREGVRPQVWIAPGHSFDATTVEVLSRLGVTSISDGFAAFPYRDSRGLLWVPQQLWRFWPMPFGVWTVCLHHNIWKEKHLEQFHRNIRSYGERITDFASVEAKYAGRLQGVLDRTVAWSLNAAWRVRRKIAN